ncbi:unnamed protein product, partial [Prorocentrum cordatum]
RRRAGRGRHGGALAALARRRLRRSGRCRHCAVLAAPAQRGVVAATAVRANAERGAADPRGGARARGAPRPAPGRPPIVVTGVDTAEARALGWRVGDVILEANGRKVRNKDELRGELTEALPSVLFLVARLAGGVHQDIPARRPRGALARRGGRRAGGGAVGGQLGARGARASAASGGGCPLLRAGGAATEVRSEVRHGGPGEIEGEVLLRSPTRIDADESRVLHKGAAGRGGIGEGAVCVGARVSVRSGHGRPLSCTVVEIEGDRAKVHYDGSGGLEGEWLLKSSLRINQEEAEIPHVEGATRDGVHEQVARVGTQASVTRLEEQWLPCTVVGGENDRVIAHCGGSSGFEHELVRKSSTRSNPKEADIPLAEVSRRDDVGDRFFDFVGAEISVTSGQGYQLPCTVVEVEEDRVKVHYDGFGEFRDEWLPKSSTRINTNKDDTSLTDGGFGDGIDVQVHFAFIGAKLSVMSGKGYPLPATVVGVEGNKVKVHYDGFGDFRDEWIPAVSERISPQ